MRARYRTVARLIAATLLVLLMSTPGRASLECDGAFAAGTFSTTTFIDGAFPEDACGGAPATTYPHRNLLRFPGIWR